MVVNNWYIIMEGYTSVTKFEGTRVFFMFYFIVMMVVLTIVVAFILEGFLFRIQVSRSKDKESSDRGYVMVRHRMSRVEMDLLCGRGDSISEWELTNVRQHSISPEDEYYSYEGFRWKDRLDFSEELYASEIKEWIETRKNEQIDLSHSPSNQLSELDHDESGGS